MFVTDILLSMVYTLEYVFLRPQICADCLKRHKIFNLGHIVLCDPQRPNQTLKTEPTLSVAASIISLPDKVDNDLHIYFY